MQLFLYWEDKAGKGNNAPIKKRICILVWTGRGRRQEIHKFQSTDTKIMKNISIMYIPKHPLPSASEISIVNSLLLLLLLFYAVV